LPSIFEKEVDESLASADAVHGEHLILLARLHRYQMKQFLTQTCSCTCNIRSEEGNPQNFAYWHNQLYLTIRRFNTRQISIQWTYFTVA